MGTISARNLPWKRFVMTGTAAFAFLTARAASAQVCEKVAVRSTVEVTGADLRLRDLLVRGACPELDAAAEQIRLGRAPLAGSPRVFPGEDVRARLRALLPHGFSEQTSWLVPERVVVRRAEVNAGWDKTQADTRSGICSARVSRGRMPMAVPTAVRPGQTVLLVWDAEGVRLMAPAVCLDRGGIGERVRARIRSSGRVLTAVVASAGELRASS